MNISGKVALVSGASEGIGAACAHVLHQRGARLVVNARSEENLRAAAPPDSLIVAGDITDPSVAERLVESAISRHGRIDLLINNAGVGLYSPSWLASLDDTRRMLELNFFAPLRLVQLVVPHMRSQRSGLIVNVTSIGGKVALPWMTLYSASKFALGAFSDGLRVELAPDGIEVMTVCPGYVKTGFQSHIIGGTVPEKIIRSKAFTISAQACAEAMARGIERGSRTVVTPRIGWAFVAAAQLFPRIVDRRLGRILR